jgi:hypothetical protein
MDEQTDRVLAFCLLLGIAGTIVGIWQCISGHNFAVAAQHEATTVGRIVRIYHGKGGPTWHYTFTVNEVRFDDYSGVCRTPLKPGACYNNGPVLVYYSFQPFQNSRLEDFSVASARDYRIGKPALAIGLPLFILTCVGIAILSRKDKDEDDPDSDFDPDSQKGASRSDDVPDSIHIAPNE